MSKQPGAPREGTTPAMNDAGPPASGPRSARPATKGPQAEAAGQRSTRTETAGQRSARPETTGPRPTRAAGARPARGRSLARRVRRPWWRGPLPLIGTVIVVIVAVVAFMIAANGNSADASIGKPVSPAILNQVVGVSPSVLAAVGAGKLENGSPIPAPYYKISGTALTLNGKPEVLYIGGDFCPYCAADRWSMVNALSRFGSFSHLTYMRSAATDGNLVTFTFHGSSYSSKYIAFKGIENADRNDNPLDPLTPQEQQLLTTLGHSGYPFLDFAGQYANDAPNAYPSGFDPNVLSGKSWTQVAAALSNPTDPITEGLIGNANSITAAVCKVTGGKPSSACATPTIRGITLP